MEKVIIQTADAPQAIGPYSQGVRAGNLIFVSGQIPLDPKSGQLVAGGIEAQTKQVLNNLQAVLKAAGTGLSSVVKTTIFLQNMQDFQRVNEIYGQYFTAPFPARSTIEVAKLPREALVEIECVAQVL